MLFATREYMDSGLQGNEWNCCKGKRKRDRRQLQQQCHGRYNRVHSIAFFLSTNIAKFDGLPFWCWLSHLFNEKV